MSSPEYDRGRIEERLASHDKHFAKINGSMEKVAAELHALVLQVQRLGDAAESDRSTVKTTAEALEKAEVARRDKSETHWTPFQRGIAAIVAACTVAATVAYFVHH